MPLQQHTTKKGSDFMDLSQEKLYTIDDIYALPDGTRAELIDGQIYYMAPPGRKHQRIVGQLFTVINNHIEQNNVTCQPYLAPFAVFLDEDDRNYVEPDISVICDPGKLNDKGCIGAPDWIIEIVSPGSRRMDYSTKLFKYRTAGVHEYWIVDSEKDRIIVYNFNQDTMEEYSFTDDIPAGIYPGFSINLSKLGL